MGALPEVELVDKLLKITDTARKDATSGLPSKSQVGIGLFEKKIRDYVLTKILAADQKNSQETLSDMHEKRANLRITETLAKISTVPNDLEAGLENLTNRRELSIKDLKVEELKAESDIKLFRKVNDLVRQPQYPESNIFHLSIIATIIIIEIILNGIFLSRGSELGVLGGVISASIITAVNILMAFLYGRYGFPQLWHSNVKNKLFGILSTIIYLSGLIAFSLLVGHYRAALQADPFEATRIAIATFHANPFGIDDFNGWVLMSISIVVSILAAIEFLRADDLYPGYGKIDRKYKKTRGDLDFAIDALYRRSSDEVLKHEEGLHKLNENANGFITAYEVLLDQSEKIVTRFDSFCGEAEKFYGSLIEVYRSSNIAVRSIGAPTYFNEDVAFEEGQMPKLDIFQLEKDKEELNTVKKQHAKTPELYQDSLKKIQEIKKINNEKVKGYLREVFDSAERAVSNQEIG